MKIKAEIGTYSSVVGGGVLLRGEDDRMIGQIAFLCHDNALRNKDAQEKLSRLCCDAINASGATLDPTAIREAALREAAQIATKEAEDCGPSYGDGYPQQSAHDIAKAILALIDKVDV